MPQPQSSRRVRVLLVDESPRRSAVLSDALAASGCDVPATVPCGVMTEDEACKTLRKMAMNRNLRLAAVARSVLQMADLL